MNILDGRDEFLRLQNEVLHSYLIDKISRTTAEKCGVELNRIFKELKKGNSYD